MSAVTYQRLPLEVCIRKSLIIDVNTRFSCSVSSYRQSLSGIVQGARVWNDNWTYQPDLIPCHQRRFVTTSTHWCRSEQEAKHVMSSVDIFYSFRERIVICKTCSSQAQSIKSSASTNYSLAVPEPVHKLYI